MKQFNTGNSLKNDHGVESTLDPRTQKSTSSASQRYTATCQDTPMSHFPVETCIKSPEKQSFVTSFSQIVEVKLLLH